MRHDERIREQARIARGLVTQRRALFEQVPFARKLEQTPRDLERIARPVIAVVGAASVGKSALIQALGSELPWKWLKIEPVESGDAPGGALAVGELAEHCLLVLPAGQSPSRDMVAWLQQLVEEFPRDSLQVVLTRLDALPEGLTPETAREQLESVLRDMFPYRTLPVLAVFSREGEGLDSLRLELAERLALRQGTLLEEALKGWSSLLADLHALLELRDLAKVQPETLSRLHLRLDELLKEEGRQLERELPWLAEESLRELEPQLPDAQRSLTRAFREKLSTRVEPRLDGLRHRVDQTLTRELARDVDSQTTLALADRFSRLVKSRTLFFDWRSAGTGGLVGMGAALLMDAVRKRGGWAVMGAALLGSVLAGVLGKGTRLSTAEELKRMVAEPLLEDARQRLEQATETSRADVERLCSLLRKVAEIFSPSQAYDPERLGQAVTQAESQQQRLDRELRELQWKHSLEELQSRFNPTPNS